MAPTRLYLADDHAILRDGLRLLLDQSEEYEIIGESGDGKQALDEIINLQPDIVILDISMPTMTGVEISNHLKNYYSTIKIIILSRHDNEVYVEELLNYGIDGYVLKENASEDLTRALEEALAGRVYLSPAITQHVVSDFRNKKESNSTEGDIDPEIYSKLSKREREVLKLLAEGRSHKDIASTLWISPATVKTHRNNIMKKLDVHNMADLVLYAVKSGMVET